MVDNPQQEPDHSVLLAGTTAKRIPMESASPSHAENRSASRMLSLAGTSAFTASGDFASQLLAERFHVLEHAVVSKLLHYWAFRWEQCSSTVCCAGYVGSVGRTLRAPTPSPVPSLAGRRNQEMCTTRPGKTVGAVYASRFPVRSGV